MARSNKIDKDQLIEMCRLGYKQREMAEAFDVNIRNVERKIAKLRAQGEDLDSPLAGGSDKAPDEERMRLTGGLYIITCGQNNTFVDKDWIASLEKYAEHRGGEILIPTCTYARNEYARKEKGDEEDWYDPAIKPYIFNHSAYITDSLVLCGELNISPTAVNPLSGLNNYVNTASAIIPHAKLRAQSLPTGRGKASRILYTTGSVTKRNYIQKKAGQKASHHHSLSALVVEVDKDGDWFVRQISYNKNKKGFYDLDKFYSSDGVTEGHRLAAINWGDIHAAKLDPIVAAVSWRNKDSILDTLKPYHTFSHDTHDGEARNSHNIKDPHFLFKMHHKESESVQGEIKTTVSVINEISRPWCKNVVVESNHDLQIERWLKTADYKDDQANAIFFLEMQLAKYKSIVHNDESFSIFEHAARMNGVDKDVIFLRQDEEYMVSGINCGNHGHLGNNGGRGTIKAYVDRGGKENIGHGHGFTIYDGVWMAGVSGLLFMGYNTGGSGWNQTHILTYDDGKRTGITIVNGKFRAEELR